MSRLCTLAIVLTCVLSSESHARNDQRKSGAKADSGTIRLGNGIEIAPLVEDGNFLGLGSVRLNGVDLRAGSSPDETPVVGFVRKGPGDMFVGGAAWVWRYSGMASSDGKTVIRTTLFAAFKKISFDIEISPVEMKVRGVSWCGLKYRFIVEDSDPGGLIGSVRDPFHWELLGGKVKVSHIVQRFEGGPQAMRFGRFATGPNTEPVRFMEQPLYGTVIPVEVSYRPAKPTMAIFTDYADVGMRNSIRSDPSDGLVYHRQQYLVCGRKIVTPYRTVVLSAAGGRQGWSDIGDYLRSRWNRRQGLAAYRAMPICFPTEKQPFHFLCWKRRDTGGEVPRNNLETMSKILPKVAASGVKWIYIGPVWNSDAVNAVQSRAALAVWDLSIPRQIGGREGMKRYCSRAHKLGLKVIVWMPLALSNKSPLLAGHPEWIIKNADNSNFTFGYKDVVGCDPGGGFGKYLLEALTELRKEVGIDGVWIDSYPTFGAAYNYARKPLPASVYPSLVKLQRQLEAAGLGPILVEGISPFGITAVDFSIKKVKGVILGNEWACNDTSFMHYEQGTEEVLDVFKMLANRATSMLPYRVFSGDLARYNRIYVEAAGDMDRRIILADDNGIAWFSDRNRNVWVWAYRDFTYQPEYRHSVCRDRVSGTVLKAGPAGGLTLKARHIYQILMKTGK